jgi:hypothetical protein
MNVSTSMQAHIDNLWMIVNELANIHPQVLDGLGIYTLTKFITLFPYLGCFAYYPN